MIRILQKLQIDKSNTLTLFTPEDIKAYFRTMDVAGRGTIDMDQYINSFPAFGIECVNFRPEGYDTNKISMDTFMLELTRALFSKKK